jgi:division protein CdvB (Snf7/Vps24/ESCRT-III family)
MELISRRQQTLVPRPEAINQLKKHSAQLNQVNGKLRERDRVLFDLCAKAIERSDMLRANIYANELNRVRHIRKMLTQSQLAIDCIAIRLETS